MTVLCDLDGVIYRGRRALPGASEALRRLHDEGIPVLYITNNSTRSPRAGAEKITAVTGVPVDPDQVLTSARAAAAMLDHDDEPVFLVGEEGVREALDSAGLEATSDPLQARSVMVGLTRAFDYELLHQAMTAVRNGARFIATNIDPTFPTEEGLTPGCGAIVAAIVSASGREPEVAGKPNPPMLDLVKMRVTEPVWVIGDRVDTDIALAAGESAWTSILVLTGVTGIEEAETSGADHIVPDFASAVDLVLAAVEQS